MAWRPTRFLIEGRLDNTVPGKVTGWMRFAGMDRKVTFNLQGDFHRDIRRAMIRMTGAGRPDDPEAAEYMARFGARQTGDVGDITAGLPPRDYVHYPYIEWYSRQNGRVVIELDPPQVQVIGRPIPACESDPISRQQQARHMAGFLGGVSREMGIPAIAPGQGLISDPAFTHWILAEGRVIGEARGVEPGEDGTSFAYVRLFDRPESAEYGPVERQYLRDKAQGLGGEAAQGSDGCGEEVRP